MVASLLLLLLTQLPATPGEAPAGCLCQEDVIAEAVLGDPLDDEVVNARRTDLAVAHHLERGLNGAGDRTPLRTPRPRTRRALEPPPRRCPGPHECRWARPGSAQRGYSHSIVAGGLELMS